MEAIGNREGVCALDTAKRKKGTEKQTGWRKRGKYWLERREQTRGGGKPVKEEKVTSL